MGSIQERIEAVLASAEPDVEVLLAEVVGGDRLRVFIDYAVAHLFQGDKA